MSSNCVDGEHQVLQIYSVIGLFDLNFNFEDPIYIGRIAVEDTVEIHLPS